MNEAAVIQGHQRSIADVLPQLLEVVAGVERGIARAAGEEEHRNVLGAARLRLDDGHREAHVGAVGLGPVLFTVEGEAARAHRVESGRPAG